MAGHIAHALCPNRNLNLMLACRERQLVAAVGVRTISLQMKPKSGERSYIVLMIKPGVFSGMNFERAFGVGLEEIAEMGM